MDIILVLIGFIIVLPIMAVVAVVIKINSPGPALYVSERIGRSGKSFKIYKFRTMVVNADKMGGPSTAADDPRLTKIGLFLKRFQLDELPQLFNVLKGDMSLVGPRPEVKIYVDIMTEEEKNVILSVRPGITDLASLWNFHEAEILKGSPDPEKTYMEKIRPEKLRLQIKYVKEMNFLTDIKIIFQTILKVFK
jgi:lipopolysaccharide/colanic/teichoic acid biosynthesis glycosyltransferase